MKTRNKINIVILLCMTLLFGCAKDFLDTSPNNQIPQDQFYKTDADATGALMACYQMLATINASPWTSLYMLKELPSGEILTGGGLRGDQPPYEEIAEFRYGPNNNVITQVYSQAYYTILRTNLVIDNVKGSDDYQKIVIAEAKTIRALMYFDLVTLWGPVPLVLHKLTPDQYQQTNATTAQIWQQIETDLKDAIQVLPIKSKLKDAGSDVARVSQGTAQALLGKALLYQKKWSDAATQFQAVIDSKEYSLNSDYSQVLRKSSEFGSESIFEISYSTDQHNTWNTPNIWADPGRTVVDNVHWQLMGPRGDAWFSGGNSGLLPGWGFGPATKDIYKAFKEANDSIRLKSSILDETTLKAMGGKIRDANNTLPYGSVGLIRLKYGTWADETVAASVATPERNFGTNLRVIRYSDVLLMAAEAYHQSGDDTKALALINQVRERVKQADLTASGNALMDSIKRERLLEFAFEGIRFQDLQRWGDAPTVLSNVGKYYFKGTFTDNVEDSVATGGLGYQSNKHEYFPFPFNETSINPKIHQNPGY